MTDREDLSLESIDRLLPHRAPMQLIDRVLAADADCLWAEASTDRQTALKDAAGVPAVAALEMLAQSSAAYFTLRARTTAGSVELCAAEPAAPAAGMLVACRVLDCRVPRWPPHHRLVAQVRVLAGAAAASSGGGLVRFAGLLWLAPAEPGIGAQDPEASPHNATALGRHYDPAAAAAQGEFSVYIPPLRSDKATDDS